jgi:Lsr2
MRVTTINDDVTGLPVTDATEVKITIDGVTGTLDLSAESLAALRALAAGDGASALAALLAPPESTAKTSRPRSGKRSGDAKPVAGTDAPVDEIRAWAKGNGFTVNDRGRVPKDAVAAFIAAHTVKPATAPTAPVAPVTTVLAPTASAITEAKPASKTGAQK